MPSIRVRDSAYSNLGDTPQEEPRSLATIFNLTVSPPPPPSSTNGPRPQTSLPTLREDALLEPLSPSAQTNSSAPFRPRAHTNASRVQAHCMESSRQSRALSAESPRSASPTRLVRPRGSMITIEGAQTDVMVSSNGEPGIIESNLSLPRSYDDDRHPRMAEPDGNHHDDIVEHLDVIDRQIGVVSNLTNAANSIVIPPLSWYTRKPVVVLPSSPRVSRVVDGEQGSPEFEDSLDRYVDDILKRPSKIRRTLLGIWSFLKTPMGFIIGIYGFLVVFWGAAIVVFLVKIINFHNANTQGFWVEVSSQVETGLFTVTSIGLIPSRILDTYRIYKIWQYKRKTVRLRAKAGLPQLFDVDDLPDPEFDPNYVHVLTKEEQKDLHRQQVKFQHHQTWYRAHGTETHRAFPINAALWICFLNDGNSIFQIFLCGTMWGLNRFERPAWSTGILIPGAFLCGIVAAVLIWRGGEKTKRVEKVRERLRAALAAEKLGRTISPRRSAADNIGLPPSIARKVKEEQHRA